MTDPARRTSRRRTVAVACSGWAYRRGGGFQLHDLERPAAGPPSHAVNVGSQDAGMASGTATLPVGKITDYRFTITGPGGRPVTNFAFAQTQRFHFYAIRSDMTGYQHVHPTLASNGTWTAALTALRPDTWRLYASFVPSTRPARGQEIVLGRTVSVPGRVVATALPAPSPSTKVDGYTVTVTITKDGRPVTNLQPYLDTYAHLTAFHEGDLAFAHLHPETKVNGDHGGPTLPCRAELSRSGNWRLFLQFQTSGTVHTAALTVHVS